MACLLVLITLALHEIVLNYASFLEWMVEYSLFSYDTGKKCFHSQETWIGLFFSRFQKKIMFSLRSHLLLICFSYLQSSILRFSLFQAAFVLNMQQLFFLPVWTFCKSADKKFWHFWCHGALLCLKENEENIHIFLLAASNLLYYTLPYLCFQCRAESVKKNLRLLMPESEHSGWFYCQWESRDIFSPWFFHSIKSWEKWHSSLNSFSQNGRSSLTGLLVCVFCRLCSKYN